ncbi:MAG: exodeoxyribonuclease VII large subunit [Comamonadaceae bacterium]|nr:exodeoxyribonuclease VII large subunit [Comamonadaceae bacterium]
MNQRFGWDAPAVAGAAPRWWGVGQLCRAVADALEARFNPVAVQGEISGFTRAASGHCYFTLKDEAGQLRCAMFRRAASLLDFAPRDGEQVQVRGRLGVYEARGDLQLVVESMCRAGQGALFEEFLQRKARLQAEGLFDEHRKRPLPAMPRGIGVVTSLHAAALHDVLTALRRRAPHVPVVVAPAAVQGAVAPGELIEALSKLYLLGQAGSAQKPVMAANAPAIDVILLVRGGGALEDLWAFNDEHLVRAVAASSVPVVSGVGHESDFTLVDFVADLRAPTPTAAAELASPERGALLAALHSQARHMQRAAGRHLDARAQHLDRLSLRLGRPANAVAAETLRLTQAAQRLRHALQMRLQREQAALARAGERLPAAAAPLLRRAREQHAALAAAVPLAAGQALHAAQERLNRAALRLELLDPKLVLARGYAWLQDEAGRPVTRAAHTHAGQRLRATLTDGRVDLRVQDRPAR